jgi:hypothetical protein
MTPIRATQKKYAFEVHGDSPAHGDIVTVWAESVWEAIDLVRAQHGANVDWQWAWTGNCATNEELWN